jgi:exodeoxyribonuclease-3
VRERNIGWRLDYFAISGGFRKNLKTAAIHPEVFGSDHCPVSIELA